MPSRIAEGSRALVLAALVLAALATVGCDGEELTAADALELTEEAQPPGREPTLVYEDEADAAVLHPPRPPLETPAREQAMIQADLPRLPADASPPPEVSALWFVRGAGLTVQNFSDKAVLVSAYFPGEAGCRFTLARRRVSEHGSLTIRPEGEARCDWSQATLLLLGEDGLPGRSIPVSRARTADEVRAP